MDVSLPSFISLYSFNTGRSIFALHNVAKAIEPREEDLSDISSHIAKALKHARNTRTLEHRFAVSKNQPRTNPKVIAIDVKLDRAIVGLRDALQAHIASGDDGEEEPVLARKILDACFPRGVQAITQTTHVEELSLVDALLAEIKKHHADAVEQLGLGAFVQRVTKLNEQYRAAQQASPPASVDFSEVRAARQRGQEFVLEVVAMIAGRFPLSTPAHVSARQALLGPVFRQNEAIRAYLRSRRTVPDVDPDTGEAQEPSVEDPAVLPEVPVTPSPVIGPDEPQPLP